MSPLPITGMETAARDFADCFPIGSAGITLRARPSVHCERSNAQLFEQLRDTFCVNRIRVPADADFGRDRKRRDRAHDCFRDGDQGWTIFQAAPSRHSSPPLC